MNKYFTIGEVAKLYNMSIETLRHYDRIELLKPSYISSESGYRYYSLEQFGKINLIKQCKAMGLTLKEIKNLLNSSKSAVDIMEVLKKQEEIIDKKIEEMKYIKKHINFLENKIATVLEKGCNNIFIREKEERSFIKYNYISKSEEELEVNMRKVLLEFEKNYGILDAKVSYEVSFKEFKERKNLVYNDIRIALEESPCKLSNMATLPKGKYLSIYFNDYYTDYKKYYLKLLDYIENNNINILGDFYESYLMIKLDERGREKSLGEIEIQIR